MECWHTGGRRRYLEPGRLFKPRRNVLLPRHLLWGPEWGMRTLSLSLYRSLHSAALTQPLHSPSRGGGLPEFKPIWLFLIDRPLQWIRTSGIRGFIISRVPWLADCIHCHGVSLDHSWQRRWVWFIIYIHIRGIHRACTYCSKQPVINVHLLFLVLAVIQPPKT